MIEDNDWRIQGQDRYLKGRTFYFHKFELYNPQWDHEHCEFCGRKIGVDGIESGYSTLDDYCWVCEECFADFEEYFSFNRFQKNDFVGKKPTSVIYGEMDSTIEGEKVYKIRKLIRLLSNLSELVFSSEKMRLMPAEVEVSYDIRKPSKLKLVGNDVTTTTENLIDELINLEDRGFQWVCLSSL